MTKKEFEELEIIKNNILTKLNNGSCSIGLVRLNLTPIEIKACNQLIKGGYLMKGRDKNNSATLTYYLTDKGRVLK